MGEPFITKENAEELGRNGGVASGEARKRNQKSAAERAVEAAGRASPELMKDLLAAARGDAPFDDLPSKLRIQALMRALEYGLGKPTLAATKPAADGEVEPPGIKITG